MGDLDPKTDDQKHFGWIKWILTIVILGLYLLGLIFNFDTENILYVGTLLFIGVISFIIALILLEQKSKFTIGVAITLMFFLSGVMVTWLLFSKMIGIYSSGWLCLIMSTLTTLFALSLTTIRIFNITPQSKEKIRLKPHFWKHPYYYFVYLIKDIQDQIKDNRVCYLFVAITLFLTTIYFTVFSFACHDRYEREHNRYGIYRIQIDQPPALWYKVKSPSTEQKQSPPNKKTSTDSSSLEKHNRFPNYIHLSQSKPESKNQKKLTLLKIDNPKFTIKFLTTRADVLCYDDVIKRLLTLFRYNLPDPDENVLTELKPYFENYEILSNNKNEMLKKIGQKEIYKKIQEQEKLLKNHKIKRTTFNMNIEEIEISYINSYALANAIFTIEHSATDNNKGNNINTRNHNIVCVSGFTSAEIITSNDMYQSNYELSEARASRVRDKILSLLLESGNPHQKQLPSVEWILIPKSYDCSDCIDKGESKQDNKKCYKAEITIKKTLFGPMERLQALCDNHSTINKNQQKINDNLLIVQQNTKILKDLDLVKKADQIQKTIEGISKKTKTLSDKYSDLSDEINKITNFTKAINENIGHMKDEIANTGWKDLNEKVKTVETILNPESKADPHLLDYFHYTIYTITTTGYGDMIPVSDFAKFLTSLTNIFEIVFGLIFFNVILSRETQIQPPEESEKRIVSP